MGLRCSENLLCWLVPLIRKGLRSHELKESDVPPVPHELRVSSVQADAEIVWNAEVAAAAKTGRQPSLLRALCRLGRAPLLISTLSGGLNGVLCTCARPLLLHGLVTNATDRSVALPLVGVLAAELLLEAATTVLMRHQFADCFGALVFSALAHLIFRKTLRVRTGHKGTPLALMGTDVPKIYEMLKQLAWVMSASIGMVCGIIVLIFTIGAASGVGIFVLVAMLAANSCITRFVKGAEHGALTAGEARIGLLSKIINGIRPIKLSAWEEDFLENATDLRRKECSHLRRYRILHIVTVQLGRMSPVLAYCGSFIFLGLGDGLTAANVFAALVVFQGFRVSLIMIPVSLVYYAQVQVALRRVADFLLQSEMGLDLPSQQAAEALPSGTALVCENAVFEWQAKGEAAKGEKGTQVAERTSVDSLVQDAFQIKVPHFCLKRSCGLGVVGRVGSGKTSLLTAFLGDMISISGKVALAPGLQISYVPQKPLIIAGTILDNILLGRSKEEGRLAAVLKGACLERDIHNMPDGLETEIGERGVTLSGGQQQRVAIARALYTSTPSLLILDDPLAAVDLVVAKNILCNVLAQRASGCAVLMALNQLSLLKDFDEVCVVVRGLVEEQGEFEELSNRPGPLRAMLRDSGTTGQASTALAPQEEDVPVKSVAAHDQKNVLVQDERREKGSIKSSVFMQYVLSMGFHRFLLVSFLVLCAYACLGCSDRWLANWINAPEGYDKVRYVGTYAALTLGFGLFCILGSISLSFASVRASKNLHDDCMHRLLHAPVSFFEETPSGRIVSRLSTDLSTVDVLLPQFLDHGTQFVGALLQIAAIICIVAPVMLVVLVFAGIVYVYCVRAVEKSNRELKRLANNAQSPVLSILGEAVQGRVLFQVMRCDSAFHQRFAQKVDELQTFTYSQTSVVHWGLLMSYMVSTFISTSTALFLILLHGGEDSDEALLGLSLGYSLQLPYFLLHSCFVFLTFKTTLASLERLLECRSSGVPQEPSWRLSGDDSLPIHWPQGHVDFKEVEFTYRQGLKPALQNVTFSVRAGDRIGVVGRTGAGKSSLVVLLFRLRDATRGTVSLDGKNVTAVGLRVLRQRMAVIPQESLLLEGSVRNNIDPFNRHTDEELVDVLTKVGFPSHLLEYMVSAGGQSISQGQHQLLALARALLRQAKLVVLDEPTSSIDAATDVMVQKAIREVFKDCTVFTIAHRIATVIDSDQVLVMDSGRVVELGPPAELCGNGHIFASMVQAAGIDSPVSNSTCHRRSITL